jgi:hypothetical protein
MGVAFAPYLHILLGAAGGGEGTTAQQEGLLLPVEAGQLDAPAQLVGWRVAHHQIAAHLH